MTHKSCLISGGTRGIGLAITRLMASKGYAVATFARTASEVDSFVGKMAEYDVPALALRGDARDDMFLKSVVDAICTRFGGLDVLVNNAGGGKVSSILEADIADWDTTLAVNLRSAMVLTKICLTYLMQKPTSAVISISSIAGKMGLAGSSSYCASKFGLIGFMQALYEEVREHGVKVCTICPGYVDTPLIPNRKALMRNEMIRSEDIAQAVNFVLESSPSACPVEIVIRPQKSPFRK